MEKYRKGLMAAVIAVLVIVFLTVTGVVYAATSDSIGKTQLSMNLRTAKLDGDAGITAISARLNFSDRLLGGQPVNFFVATNFFGQREMLLGTATTDATGIATIKYYPKWEGTHVITARFPGNADFAPAMVKLSFDVSAPIAPYVPESILLTQVGQWATLGAGLMVVAVWGTLLFIAIYTTRGIARIHE